MATIHRKLPTGTQSFEIIRQDNSIYVDKTKYPVDLIDRGRIYFLSRPRRFGKSLTVSTFDAMFSGKKELFKGLYAEEFMNRPDYHASPVIWLDMSRVTTNMGIEKLEFSLKLKMIDIAQKFEVNIPDNYSSGDAFDLLIKSVADKHGKVVILVDEYDHPYTDFVTDHEMAERVRGILRDVYIRIKANDKYIRFVFITGISKFARFGVFSGLNNPVDISLDKTYGEMLGLTEQEIVDNFPEYLEETANEMQLSVAELLEKMRNFYDGFCFDGIHRLYNPFSTVNFFLQKEFDNFWIESGTTKLIADYLKTRNLTVEQFRNFPVTRDFVRMPGDMDSTPPEGFLYQGGFLTIRQGNISEYMLDYPNTEVLNAMSVLLARNILTADSSFENLQGLMILALTDRDIDELIDVINKLLASIPYDDFSKAGQQSIKYNRLKIQVQEWLYRSTILAFLRGCGVATVAEMHTNLGRADLVLTHRGNVYVIELKVAYKPEEVKTKLAEAKAQIIDNNYAAPYSNVTSIALVIDDTKRQITMSEAW